MKILLSLNDKFTKRTPRDLINLIQENDVSNSIQGFEIYLNLDNNEEVKYFEEFINLSIKNNYLIQFHSIQTEDIDKQKQYLDFYNEIAKKLEYPLKVVFHSFDIGNIEENINYTSKYMADLLNYIYTNKFNLMLSIENLNARDNNRLNKEQIIRIIANNNDLMFTYDIGHEILSYGNIIDLNEILISKLVNVHLHTFLYDNDHKSLYSKDPNKSKWIKAILYLKSLNYNETIVLEYDLYDMIGESYEEKLFNYIESAETIKSYF
ncbi:MAG: hypothetical protein PHH04_08935 [Thomasclavelia sp.]|nr:hypothetical protein [Thomasclavelia sp.]